MPAILRLILVSAAGVLWTSPAQAYLDPTTGSILLQGLLAGIAGVAVVLRLYWFKIKALLRRLAGKRAAQP